MSKTAIVVDGAYAYKTVKSIDTRYVPDYRKIRIVSEKLLFSNVVDARYFNSVDNDYETDESTNLFHDFLEKPYSEGGGGFKVKLYDLKEDLLWWPDGTPVVHPITGKQFNHRKQRGVDVGIGFFTIASFIEHEWDHLVLFAGDSDFYDVVEHLVHVEGVKVTLIGCKGSISGDLLKIATVWYLDDMGETFVHWTGRYS